MKEDFFEQVRKLLMEDSRELEREDYRNLLHEVIDECKAMLSAMDTDETEDEE